MDVRPNDRFQLAPEVLFQPFEDEALLIDLQHETIFSLNRTGRRIVELVRNKLSFQQMTEKLEAEFEIGSCDIGTELSELIQSLLNRKLIVRLPDGA